MKVMQSTNVMVYITVGRHMHKLEEGRLQVMLSQGIEFDKAHELSFVPHSMNASIARVTQEEPKYKKVQDL